MNFGHPPARGARVPLRFAKGGNGVLCFSLVSRVRGNDVGSGGMGWGEWELLLVAPSGVAALCTAESCERLGCVGDDSPFVFGGAVFGEGVG